MATPCPKRQLRALRSETPTHRIPDGHSVDVTGEDRRNYNAPFGGADRSLLTGWSSVRILIGQLRVATRFTDRVHRGDMHELTVIWFKYRPSDHFANSNPAAGCGSNWRRDLIFHGAAQRRG